jgi:hypothetical protein
MTFYDALAEKDAEQMYEAWKQRFDAVQKEIVDLVTKRVESDVVGEFGGYLEGSYNICLVVKLNGKPTYVIRFPRPGKTAACFLDEKVRMKVQVMNMLHKTIIPLPRLYSWGLTSQSTQYGDSYIEIGAADACRLLALVSSSRVKIPTSHVPITCFQNVRCGPGNVLKSP